MNDTVKINLNERIRVKLTATGIKAYVDYMNEPNVAAKHGQPVKTKYLLPTIDDEGYTTFMLWEFMSIFGRYFYMGNNDHVIMPLEIIKCKPEVCTPENKER